MRHSNKQFGVTLVAAMAFVLANIHGLSAQELANFMADADGIEPPDVGAAYELPVTAVAATKLPLVRPGLAALLADADGIEPPDIGMAYDIEGSFKVVAERQGKTSQ